MDDLEIIEGKKIKKSTSLFEVINNNDADLKINDQNYLKHPLFMINFPPDAKLLPPKPIMLDVCSTFLSYPDISEKVKALPEKNKGTLGSIASSVWGFFGKK